MLRVRRISRPCLLPLLAALAACGDAPHPSPTVRPAEALAWQGIVACADCAGIDTRLRLDPRRGAVAHYQLVEAFLDDTGAEYFREEGRWEQSGDLLTLRARSGALRRYRIDGEGGLVAVDHAGRAAGPGRELSPVPVDPRGP